MDARLAGLIDFYVASAAPAMRELPVFNPNLRVEAVDFRERAGRYSGILITPWCMNLILFAGKEDAWSTLSADRPVAIDFPAGKQTCMLSVQDGVALHLNLPLFTTMMHFDCQQTARRIAGQVLGSIYQREEPAATGRASSHRMTRRELLFGLGQNADA